MSRTKRLRLGGKAKQGEENSLTSLERTLGTAGANAAAAIQLGDLWIDSRKVEEVLHRYVKHLFACHQFKQHWVPDEIAFCIFKTDTIISATSMVEPILDEHNRDTDYVDARAFGFDIAKYDYSNLESEFFPATDERIWPEDSHNYPLLVYGYPTCLQDVDYSTPKVASKAIEVTGLYDGGTNSPHVNRIRLDRNSQFDADGMSGGPVFYIGRGRRGYFIGWAGMVIRGGGPACEFIHFLSSRYLVEMTFHHPIGEAT